MSNCKYGEYYKPSLEECFNCADICIDRDKMGSTLQNCLELCPGYLDREDSTSGAGFLEIGLPILVVVAVVGSLLGGYFYRRKQREEPQSPPIAPEEPSVTLTLEERGDSVQEQDSGVKTLDSTENVSLLDTENSESTTDENIRRTPRYHNSASEETVSKQVY